MSRVDVQAWRERRNNKRVFVGWWHKLLMGGVFAFMAWVIWIVMTDGHEEATNIDLGIVLVFIFVVLSVRCFRGAYFAVSDAGVVVRAVQRSHKFSWSEVEDVWVDRGGSVYAINWRVPHISLNSGRHIVCDEVRSLREPSIVDDVVAEAQRRLQLYRDAHPLNGCEGDEFTSPLN